MERSPEPRDGAEQELLVGWLAFHRDALGAKCAGLDDAQLAERTCKPSPLSLVGLMRHLTEMERVYGDWALGPAGPLATVWGEYTDGGPDWDFEATAADVDPSRTAWMTARAVTDERIAALDSLDAVGGGNRRSLRWNLHKLVGEYARHNGHADLLRERLDGATGE